MPLAARLGDTISHGGAIVSGSPIVFIDGRPGARLGDAVACSLHGPQVIVTGSAIVSYDCMPAARMGDTTSCGATIVSGSPIVIVD